MRTLRAELDGSGRALLDIGQRTIVLLDSQGAADGGSRNAAAVDPDGSIAWRHPVDPAGSCCPSILDLDGAQHPHLRRSRRWQYAVNGPRTSLPSRQPSSGIVMR
jgi:hypothetical protein